MKKYILILTILLTTICMNVKAEDTECLKYDGLCFTYPIPSYKLSPPLKEVGSGGVLQFQKADTFFNLSKNHCQQLGFRLPKKDEAALVFEYLQWVPFEDSQMYLWLDEETDSALTPVLEYNPKSSLFSSATGKVYDMAKHRSQFVCAMCIKKIESSK